MSVHQNMHQDGADSAFLSLAGYLP